MATLHEKLQQLYALAEEIDSMAPNVSDDTDYENLFSNIHDVTDAFKDIGTTDGIVPETHIIELVIVTEGTDDDYKDMLNNLDTQYPEFICDYDNEQVDEKHISKSKVEFTAHFKGLWNGPEEDCARLTHHAEGLYEDTRLENTHVEVCIDGTWYGRTE